MAEVGPDLKTRWESWERSNPEKKKKGKKTKGVNSRRGLWGGRNLGVKTSFRWGDGRKEKLNSARPRKGKRGKGRSEKRSPSVQQDSISRGKPRKKKK